MESYKVKIELEKFNDKDVIKKYGAKWDIENKFWFIDKRYIKIDNLKALIKIIDKRDTIDDAPKIILCCRDVNKILDDVSKRDEDYKNSKKDQFINMVENILKKEAKK